MKRRRTELTAITVIIVMLLSCALCRAGTEEAADGWISITVGEKASEFSVQGIRLAVYLVATGDYGNWTMESAFSDIQVFTRSDGSATVDMALSQIRRRIGDRKITPAAEGVTDQNGKAEFRNLTHGIYYTAMTEGPDRLTLSPMLLAVPNRSGNLQIRAVAKYEYETPTPSPTPTARPTLTPFAPPDEPTPSTTPKPTDKVTGKPTQKPEKTPTVTREPVPTPAPVTDRTPVPVHVPTLPPNPGEETVAIEEYEAELGLGNIQMHVGVCFE